MLVAIKSRIQCNPVSDKRWSDCHRSYCVLFSQLFVLWKIHLLKMIILQKFCILCLFVSFHGLFELSAAQQWSNNRRVSIEIYIYEIVSCVSDYDKENKKWKQFPHNRVNPSWESSGGIISFIYLHFIFLYLGFKIFNRRNKKNRNRHTWNNY